MTHPYKSKFEARIAASLLARKVPFKYELWSYEYEQVRWYTPDWFLPGGVIVETKGKFTGADRTKMLDVKEQHPDLDIRLVFMKDNPIRKGSKTKCSQWAANHGFPYAIGNIPDEWIKRRR